MNTVPVTIQVPQAEKDLIDALIKLISDVKAKSGISSIVNDSIPAVIKIVGEYNELGTEFKSPQSAEAALYLEQSLFALFAPQTQPTA